MKHIKNILNDLDDAYINKSDELNTVYWKKIKKLREEIINPDDGAYFAVLGRKSHTDNQWILFSSKLFDSKSSAQRQLNFIKENCCEDFQFRIGRVVTFETNIS